MCFQKCCKIVFSTFDFLVKQKHGGKSSQKSLSWFKKKLICFSDIHHWRKSKLLNWIQIYDGVRRWLRVLNYNELLFELLGWKCGTAVWMWREATGQQVKTILFTQCSRINLNKRFLPRPNTTSAWKLTPHRSNVCKN